MTFKKRIRTQFQSNLRRMGLFCKKPTKVTQRIRVAKTIHPDGGTTVYDSYLSKLPIQINSIESEIHVFLENKKLSSPKCNFNTNTKSCSCGKTLDDFLLSVCK